MTLGVDNFSINKNNKTMKYLQTTIILTILIIILTGCSENTQTTGTSDIETYEAVVYIDNDKQLDRDDYLKATVVSSTEDVGQSVRLDAEGFPEGIPPRQRFYIEYISQWTLVVTDYGTERPAFDTQYNQVELHTLKELNYPIATTDRGEFDYSEMLEDRGKIAPPINVGDQFYATTGNGKITSI